MKKMMLFYTLNDYNYSVQHSHMHESKSIQNQTSSRKMLDKEGAKSKKNQSEI